MTLTAQNHGTRIIRRNADIEVRDLVSSMVTEHTARWIFDPEVDGVVALVRTGTRRPLVVVYIEDDDFEISEEFEALLSA